ncbi:MAG TPA: hypothetical protein PLV45_17495, partial [bacterium]|nr:hypothetical protein [bacterium]
EHPGGWRWLNARTLQFTPSRPWPAFTRFSIRAGRTEVNPRTVLPPPVRTVPRDGDDDALPVETIQLTFPVAPDPDMLAEEIHIELWDGGLKEPVPRQILGSEHFSVKRLDPASETGETTCVLTLFQPIPHGTTARLRIALAGDTGHAPVYELTFKTSREFSALAAGAGTTWLPLSSHGTAGERMEALNLETNPPVLNIRMSSIPVPDQPAALWDFIHIAPEVKGLELKIRDRIIEIGGEFAPDTVYHATLRPTSLLKDHRNRTLHLDDFIEFPFVFRTPDPLLEWECHTAVVERYGPKMLPIRGRGNHTAELRLYKIDPLDRRLWPFPETPVRTDPMEKPPGPLTQREYHDQTRYESPWDLQETLKTFGSPNVTELINLPLNTMGPAGRYGLDIASYLETIDGRNAPGTYLAALQPMDSPGERQWIRLQVTDLSLTTVEEPDRITFIISSLGSARPLADVRVTVEGFQRGEWIRLISGTTDAMGVYAWQQTDSEMRVYPRRVRIERGRDQLILDAYHPPKVFRDGYWSDEGDWLAMPINYPETSYREKQTGHVFTERPVYRPGEPVHVRGWLRQRDHGRFKIPDGG